MIINQGSDNGKLGRVSVGGAKQPVYFSDGTATAGTALQDGAYKAVDTTVTQNSTNLVTSGAVYTAINSGGGGVEKISNAKISWNNYYFYNEDGEEDEYSFWISGISWDCVITDSSTTGTLILDISSNIKCGYSRVGTTTKTNVSENSGTYYQYSIPVTNAELKSSTWGGVGEWVHTTYFGDISCASDQKFIGSRYLSHNSTPNLNLATLKLSTGESYVFTATKI